MSAPAPAESARARKVARRLADAYPDAWCALRHENAWQLLVATILSAQCTDERVNMVTPELFRRFPTPAALGAADPAALEALVHSTGFFRQKTKSLLAVGKALAERYDGEVPRDMGLLVQLPGIGRKTANVVLGTVFGVPSIMVDTHVTRLSHRLGFTVEDDPGKIERDLQALLPPAEWTAFSHRLIHHGRRICIARAPRCDDCPIVQLCPRIGVADRKKAAPRPARAAATRRRPKR